MLEKNTWEAIKEQLHHKLTSEAYQNWVSRTEFLELDGARLRVAVPDEVTKIWLESEYAPKVATAIRDLQLSIAEIHYELAPLSAMPLDHRSSRPINGASAAPAPEFPAVNSQLNPRLTFSSFVVGSCNQFAHAAALAVADSPSKSYNPLFIYGGSGMGKTHLIHAIGRALIDHHGALRLVYTSGERFMNEMIHCIRTDRMAAFHQHYRTADALLIDDIHSLAGKERTQEEFFHTFNELYDHQKQIVISSDQMPKNTPGLVERLRTRFEWGLMVDVQPPDLETKMAILDKKAEMEGIRLPEDVRIYIATKTKSSVRELEGAWTKLLAYSSVTNIPINLPMAQQALKQLLPGPERRVTIDAVVRAVAERYNLQPSQLKQKTNAHEIARPRQVAMYICKDLTSASLPEIGRHFGGKHHTTVLHSIRKVEELRQADPDLNRLIHSVSDSFN
ncbi:chromosomal replication initiator protein DnaA [uncultured Paludibaculum sp.]|uniref:chromosomal replication initiator protein DnaA n=1 Tax=uncultured Paludibaculum sp. TaxID=1765020 RepID=UPI002AABF60B|nr:chromosomal replication initiator protein DnaA [uncultured Paludibaculum sp.]